MTVGKVYGLGVGPGDPELLTLKALRVLQSVQVVAYPAAENLPSFCRQIVSRHLPGGQREIRFAMPMVTERFPAAEAYDLAEQAIRAELDAGQNVAVLCEGDPFFYGSFMYLFGRLAGAYAIEVVPGVSSLTACAAAASMPLVSRNDTLLILPAPLDEERLRAGLETHEAFAIMKVGRHLGRVRALIAELGLLDQAVYIERASLPEQRVLPLSQAAEHHAPYFSMILLHKRGRAYAL